MKQIWARLKGETPIFFKGVIKVGLLLSAVGGAILAIPTAMTAAGVLIVIPPIITTIGGILTTGGIVASAIGKLTVVDPTKLP